MRVTEVEYAALLARRLVRANGVVEAPVRRPCVPLPQIPSGPTARYRSQTESRFVGEVLVPWQQAGRIVAWWYEPCKGLYLCPRTSYTPDVLVQMPPGDAHPLIFYEVKGGKIWRQDWIKCKQAAAIYACFSFMRAQWTDGRWHFQHVPAV